MFELIVTESIRFPEPTTTSRPSHSSLTAVTFAKARAEHFFRLLSDANERPRGQMGRQMQEWKALTVSRGLAPADMATRSSELSA
ncbi:hypothetical protein M405DRAFT_828007 [Rhizopogon salebrosus TDB-379]|nr:hypothetical protein M405DRAFT_828007 [Rhizopogon salebrosus TDB-379]